MVKEKKPRGIGVFDGVCAVGAVLCTLYYIFCGSLFGYSTSILYVWLMIAAVLAVKVGLGVWAKKSRVKLLRVLNGIADTAVVIAALVVLTFTGIVIGQTAEQPDDDIPCIVVLGARVRGTVPTMPLYVRVGAAYDYLSEHPESIAVCSGGKGSGEAVSEAECIADLLISRGISPDRLILEDRSTNTSENIAFTRQKLAEAGIQPEKIGVVSNAFHLPRAKRFAAKTFGKDTAVEGIPAPFVHPLTPHYIIRELVAFIMEAGELFA